jgi:hypothetical protein
MKVTRQMLIIAVVVLLGYIVYTNYMTPSDY